MGGNMGCLNMIPISTVNLVNSVEKKKKWVSPAWKSEQSRAVTGGYWGNYGSLTKFFMFEPVGFAFMYITLVDYFGK